MNHDSATLYNPEIELEEWQIGEYIYPFCPNCNTYTRHALSTSHQFFSCACGHQVDIILKETENEPRFD